MSKWYIWVHMDWIGFTCSCYKFEKKQFSLKQFCISDGPHVFSASQPSVRWNFQRPFAHGILPQLQSSSAVPMTATVAWKQGLNLTTWDHHDFWLLLHAWNPCRLTLSLRDCLLATLFLAAAPVMDSRELRIERRQKMFKKSCQSPQPTFTTSRETSLPSRSWSPILQGANLITHGLGRGMDGPIVILGIVDSKLGPQGERRWWKSVERISDQHLLQNRVWVYSTLAAGWNPPKYIKYYQVITRSLRPSLDASGDAHFLKPSVNALVAPAVLQRIVPQISRPVLGQTDAFKVWRLLLRYSS